VVAFVNVNGSFSQTRAINQQIVSVYPLFGVRLEVPLWRVTLKLGLRLYATIR